MRKRKTDLSDIPAEVLETLRVTLRKRAQTRERVRRYRAKRAGHVTQDVTLSSGAVPVTLVPEPRVLADVRSYDGLVKAIVARRMELGLTQMEVDELSGLQPGYCGKIEKHTQNFGRVMGELSFTLMMVTLGLSLQVSESSVVKIDRVMVGSRRRGAQPSKKSKR